MIVSDLGIKKLIKKGYLPKGLKIGPSSIDLTLANSFSWPDPENKKIILGEPVKHKIIKTNQFILKPNDFVLASTNEIIRVPDYMAAYVEGRSSIGRLGLQVQNAGFIDAGFHGQITLELDNQSAFPIILNKGVRICQIVFLKMENNAEKPYAGKYKGQSGATPSKLESDPEFIKRN